MRAKFHNMKTKDPFIKGTRLSGFQSTFLRMQLYELKSFQVNREFMNKKSKYMDQNGNSQNPNFQGLGQTTCRLGFNKENE